MLDGASRHAPSHGSSIHEPQEDYWRERQQREDAPSSSSKPPSNADLLFPPCFIALSGLACWHAPASPPLLFSAPVLFLFLVPCYVLGVLLFVVKLGGFAPPQARLPASRLVAASSAALLCASFFSFVAWQLPLIWNDDHKMKSFLPLLRLRLRSECVTLVLCFSLFLALQLSLARADPGRVVEGGGGGGGGASTSSSISSSPTALLPSHHAGSCHTCTTLRPLRSKHCRACDRCTLLFDHHCPVVANCVGSRTLPRFLVFLKVTATGQLLMLRLACVAAFIAFGGGGTESGGEKASSFFSVLAAASTSARGQLLLCVVQFPIFLSTLLLVARGFFCAAANLTVNELANRERYAYLKHDADGGESGSFVYVNRFDRGVVRNLSSFFGLEGLVSSVSPPALASSSSSSSSLSPHDSHYWSEQLDLALAEHGPAGLQPAPLGTKVVRWLDDRRRRRREGKSMRKGGGKVSGDGGFAGAPAASPSSVDLELAPLWGTGGGGGGGGGTSL